MKAYTYRLKAEILVTVYVENDESLVEELNDRLKASSGQLERVERECTLDGFYRSDLILLAQELPAPETIEEIA